MSKVLGFMRLIFFLFLISCGCAFSQRLPDSPNTPKGALVISASAERNDFYSSFTYIKPIKSFYLNPSIGFGVIHSLIQSNLFLRVGTDLIYNPLQKYFGGNQLVTLGVGGGYYFSFYNRPSFTSHHELCAGYVLRVGGRIKFFQKTFIGLMSESFSGSSREVRLIYPNFHFSIGLSYEI